MAGAGFKTFTAGDVLGASDVNTYLMQQAVTVFADSTARDSSIGSPTEGMVAYLKDSDRLFSYTTVSPAGWRPVSPFTMEARNTDAGTGTVTVTFTSGRFTQPPVVTVTVVSSTTGATSATMSAPTASGVTVYVWAGGSAAAVSRTVNVQAIQMTSSNGAG
jgi:hypothetical protein